MWKVTVHEEADSEIYEAALYYEEREVWEPKTNHRYKLMVEDF